MILDRFIGLDIGPNFKVIQKHSVRIVVKNKGKYLMISTKRGTLFFLVGALKRVNLMKRPPRENYKKKRVIELRVTLYT